MRGLAFLLCFPTTLSAYHIIPESRRSLFSRIFRSSAPFVAPTVAQAVTVADPRFAVSSGMDVFRRSRTIDSVKESINQFDEAIKIDKRYEKYLWQRGLSLYYADRFEEGSVQFRRDVEANPSDAEEAIWAVLCEARTDGFVKARQQMIKTNPDSRPALRLAYDAFSTGDAPPALIALAKEDDSNGQSSGAFYAKLYLGLLAEAKGDEADAKRWIVEASESAYGKRSNDYMWALANVHKSIRGW